MTDARSPSPNTRERPRALDLFCGAGGAAMGLYRAGFDVTGIDNRPQPRYPFRFIQADALKPPVRLEDFDLVWASPPCQAFTLANNGDARGLHADLIEPVRTMLASFHGPTVIENVPPAPIRPDVVLDGGMFPELRVIRRRHFECSFPVAFVMGMPVRGAVSRLGYATALDGTLSSHSRAARRKQGRPTRDSSEYVAAAMGIDWTSNRHEVGQAIPPAYSEHIGRYAMMALGRLDA
jgi:DNA (cytosine-5)-methyltransferase 1